MKGFEKERKKQSNQPWGMPHFFTFIIGSTIILILILTLLNHNEFKLENILPAGISLANSILAYLVSKKKQGERSYKKMMSDIKTWTIIRFVVLALCLFLTVMLSALEALPFLFSFIGFYIMHQLITLVVLQKEANS
ncbi:MAG: hypothetical protein WCT23_09130 [Candidatus Neomarinimicrobiota bacterium]|jgi:hypothetical protein